MPAENGKKSDPPLEEILNENGYSLEWLMEKLEATDKPFRQARGKRQIKKTTAKNIGDGLGYCAQIFRVVFEFEDDGEDYSLVIKLPTDKLITETFNEKMDKEMKDALRKLAWVLHDRECEAHTLLNQLRTTNFPIPVVYGSEKHDVDHRPGILLMEDMSDRGKTVDALDALSADQCISLARCFADFQSFVEMLPEHAWRNQFKESVHIRKDNVKELQKKMKPVLEFRPDEQLDIVKNYLSMDLYEFTKYALRELPEKLNATTLLHGDAWSHNVLFGQEEDGSIGDKPTAILDWATMFEGNPLYDIGRFMFCCTDGEVRREILPRVLDAYYDHLSKTLAHHNLKPRFTREQADELYEWTALRQTIALIELFASNGLPLFEDEKDEAAVERGERLWKRTRLAFEDTVELMRKYDVMKKFPRKDDGQ